MHDDHDPFAAEIEEMPNDPSLYATPEDVLAYRSMPYAPPPLRPGQVRLCATTAPVKHERITDAMLQRDSRVARGGGGEARRKVEPKPLTPQERIDRHQAAVRADDPLTYLPESDGARLNRHALAELRKAERKIDDVGRGGRPRKGDAPREVLSARCDPKTIAFLRAAQISPGTFLDRMVEGMMGDPSAVASLEKALTELENRDSVD